MFGLAESDKDESRAGDEQAAIVVVPRLITSGLSALMGNYSSSDSGSDQEPEGKSEQIGFF